MKLILEKICTQCGQTKLVENFYKKNTNKDGLRCECIECLKKYRIDHKDNMSLWRKANKKIISESNKEYRKKHRKELLDKKRAWDANNNERIKEYSKKRSKILKDRGEEEIFYPKKQKCFECGKNKSASSFKKCRNNVGGLSCRCKKCDKKNRGINRLKIKQWSKKYNYNHKKSINQYKRLKRKNDLNYKILCNSRVRIYHAIKSQNTKKFHKTMDLISCSISALKKYIESKFDKGMSWDNYGVNGWHIDHIKPCALFDLTKEDNQKKCFHYSNLQPLWETDNFKKNSFYNGKMIRKNNIYV